MQLGPDADQSRCVGNERRDQKREVSATQWGQSGDGSRDHSAKHESKENLVGVTVRHKKEIAGKTPKYAVGGDAINRSASPPPRFRDWRTIPQVGASQRTTTRIDPEDQKQPDDQESLRD